MATHHERRVTIPSDLWDSLGYYVADERLKLPKELQGSITHESAVVGILAVKLTEAKHYPPPPRNTLEPEEKIKLSAGSVHLTKGL